MNDTRKRDHGRYGFPDFCTEEFKVKFVGRELMERFEVLEGFIGNGLGLEGEGLAAESL